MVSKSATVNSKKSAPFTGLTHDEVVKQRELNGVNKGITPKNLLLENITSVIKEPMFILLLVACSIYLILKETGEAFIMLIALVFVAGIDVFQNFRSQKAVKALSKITESKTKVIRNGETCMVPIAEVVTMDIIICEEGNVIPADAEIITSNDFAINEAVLTGESVSVEKFQGDPLLQGTIVVKGYCYATVTSVGKETVLSGIGELVGTTGTERTPLQIKVSRFVKNMVIAGSIAFAFVWIYYWWESRNVFQGLLHGLTMAMSVLPEEIPVALSTFMAIGAFRLLKKGVIARSPKTVETLGSATVICVDKTGTLTRNLMNVKHTFLISSREEVNFSRDEVDYSTAGKANEVLEYAMWASEENPFDPMEKSIHKIYSEFSEYDKRTDYKMVKEFPLSGNPPAMTHVFEDSNGQLIISCKGALEGVLKWCSINAEEKKLALSKGAAYAQEGLRVLGVASGNWKRNGYPDLLEDIEFTFLGLITFHDPPDPAIPQVIQGFYRAGIDVKMITGDFPETAVAIARQTGIKTDKTMTGEEISKLNKNEIYREVTSTNIFARVSPEVKLRIIDVLKQSGEIVAMTGDGVNDAPALKSAHIGVAMGKRGTEVAKGAAGIILSGDDLSKMIDAIIIGRRINENLTKAIRYIISIHIPIILLVIFPIFFKWLPAMLFSPIHIIFLELIMGPTCSLLFENEPTPPEELKYPSNSDRRALLKNTELLLTVIQGLMITLGCVFAGYYASQSGFGEIKVRTYIFSTLIFSNIFLTLFNRSFKQTIFSTLKMKNRLVPIIISISLLLLFLILYLPWLNSVFSVSPLLPKELLLTFTIAIGATAWVDIYKYLRSAGNRVN